MKLDALIAARVKRHVTEELVPNVVGVNLSKEVQRELQQVLSPKDFDLRAFGRFVVVKLFGDYKSVYVLEEITKLTHDVGGRHIVVYFSHDNNLGAVLHRLKGWEEKNGNRPVPLWSAGKNVFEHLGHAYMNVADAVGDLWHHETFNHPARKAQPRLSAAELDFFNQHRPGSNVVNLDDFRKNK